MSKFKIGDRVKVIKSSFMEEKTIGAKGTVVAIDKDDDILVKLDNDIGSYNYCIYNNYRSDKADLLNTNDEQIVHLKQIDMIKLKWIYLLGSVIQTIAFVFALFKGDIAIANTHLILAILLFNWYKDSVREVNLSSRIDSKDLALIIERNKVRNN